MPVLANARHERFAQEMAKGASQVDAYELAGYAPNPSHASRLAANESIERRVAEIMSAAAERVEITQARVLEELGKIGFSDIRKLFNDSGSLVSVTELDDAAAASLASIEVTQRKVRGGDDDELETVSKIRLWDKRAALVDIGKHLGMFKERVEHTGKDGAAIEIADPDLARLVAFMLTKASK